MHSSSSESATIAANAPSSSAASAGPASASMKVPSAHTIAKLADIVDDLFNGCKEIVLHFNMGIYNGLDQLTHTGPETYTNRVVERMHAIDALCDEMLVDLGPGAELEAIFAPPAVHSSATPLSHVPLQPPSQSRAPADDDGNAMQIDTEPSPPSSVASLPPRNMHSTNATAIHELDPQKWATDFLLSVFEADAVAVMGQGKQGVLTAPPSPTLAAGSGGGVGPELGGGAVDKSGERVEDELMAMLVD